MRALIVLAGATGSLLFVSGLPFLRRVSLRDRVLPYMGAGPRARGTRPRLNLSRIAGRRDGSEHLARRLAEAGAIIGVDRYRSEQLVWALLGGGSMATFIALAIMSGAALRPAGACASILVAGTIGWLARDWWLGHQASSVKDAIREELPTAIDLVTLSIMAGETVPVAFKRVAAHLKGDTGRELMRTVDEIRDGASVVDALERMGQRVDDPAVHRFIDALCGAIERGTPLAEVLLAQAEDGREAKRRRLLETGGRREVLMLIPVVFLIMPVVVVIALYPGLVALDLFVP